MQMLPVKGRGSLLGSLDKWSLGGSLFPTNSGSEIPKRKERKSTQYMPKLDCLCPLDWIHPAEYTDRKFSLCYSYSTYKCKRRPWDWLCLWYSQNQTNYLELQWSICNCCTRVESSLLPWGISSSQTPTSPHSYILQWPGRSASLVRPPPLGNKLPAIEWRPDCTQRWRSFYFSPYWHNRNHSVQWPLECKDGGK